MRMSKSGEKSLQVVGLFVEGSLRDRTRNSVDKLWTALAAHCGAPVELRVFGIDKSQILGLQPDKVPRKADATRRGSSRERLDAMIDRAVRGGVQRVVVAFDAWPPNEILDEPCRRTEIIFLLDGLAASTLLPTSLRDGAAHLAARYREVKLQPRTGSFEGIEVLYMDPMLRRCLSATRGLLETPSGMGRTRKTGRNSRPQPSSLISTSSVRPSTWLTRMSFARWVVATQIARRHGVYELWRRRRRQLRSGNTTFLSASASCFARLLS